MAKATIKIKKVEKVIFEDKPVGITLELTPKEAWLVCFATGSITGGSIGGLREIAADIFNTLEPKFKDRPSSKMCAITESPLKLVGMTSIDDAMYELKDK